MKKLASLLSFIFVFILLTGCRDSNDIPEDIHEHEEIEKVVLTAVNKNNAQDVQTVNYIGGTPDVSLYLLEGETYVVSLDFQVKHDDHYHSVNDEIVEEKDEHFITYEFSGTNIDVVRSTDDEVRTDGNKLGLKTEWLVNSSASLANASIKLVHLPSTVEQNYPSATNQQGRTTGGETDVNMIIKIN